MLFNKIYHLKMPAYIKTELGKNTQLNSVVIQVYKYNKFLVFNAALCYSEVRDTLTNELNVHYFKDGCILRKDRYMERCTKNKVKLFLYSNIYYLLNRLPTNIIGINNYSYLQDELNKLLLQIEGGNY